MNPIYRQVWELATKEVDHFIQLHKISLTDYTFNDFFNHVIKKHNIKVFPHHFNNELILGLTMIDHLGISFSYEANNIPTRQNFTKCHELGHFILQHQGNIFTENEKNNNQQEREADYFSSLILMPDIILIVKIIYQNKTYKQLEEELEVSSKALEVRLVQFLKHHANIPYNKACGFVSSYRAGTNNKLWEVFYQCRKSIITTYKNHCPTPLEMIEHLLKNKVFIHDLEVPKLIDKQFVENLLISRPNLSKSLYFDGRIALHYIWDNTKLTEEEAKRKAKFAHFDKLQEVRPDIF